MNPLESIITGAAVFVVGFAMLVAGIGGNMGTYLMCVSIGFILGRLDT